MSGPLHGLRIVEVAGLGPGPFAAMMLADHGAEVIRVQHPDAPVETRDPLLRSRTILSLDLKKQEDREQFRRLCRCCDALIEGFRPGVMERLGLGPEVLLLAEVYKPFLQPKGYRLAITGRLSDKKAA